MSDKKITIPCPCCGAKPPYISKNNCMDILDVYDLTCNVCGVKVNDMVNKILIKEEKLLNKKKFMQEYVLSRTLTLPGGFYGESVAKNAELAFNYIEKVTQDNE
jgi:hypothetical protein